MYRRYMILVRLFRLILYLSIYSLPLFYIHTQLIYVHSHCYHLKRDEKALSFLSVLQNNINSSFAYTLLIHKL